MHPEAKSPISRNPLYIMTRIVQHHIPTILTINTSHHPHPFPNSTPFPQLTTLHHDSPQCTIPEESQKGGNTCQGTKAVDLKNVLPNKPFCCKYGGRDYFRNYFADVVSFLFFLDFWGFWGSPFGYSGICVWVGVANW